MMDERKIYNRSQNKPVDNTATDYHRNNCIDLHPPPLYHRQGFCHCSVINTNDISGNTTRTSPYNTVIKFSDFYIP